MLKEPLRLWAVVFHNRSQKKKKKTFNSLLADIKLFCEILHERAGMNGQLFVIRLEPPGYLVNKPAPESPIEMQKKTQNTHAPLTVCLSLSLSAWGPPSYHMTAVFLCGSVERNQPWECGPTRQHSNGHSVRGQALQMNINH